MRRTHIARGILRFAIVAIARTKSDDWRIRPGRVEETKGRHIQLPLVSERSHLRGRPRRDERDEQGISAVGVFGCEIKFHG